MFEVDCTDICQITVNFLSVRHISKQLLFSLDYDHREPLNDTTITCMRHHKWCTHCIPSI